MKVNRYHERLTLEHHRLEKQPTPWVRWLWRRWVGPNKTMNHVSLDFSFMRRPITCIMISLLAAGTVVAQRRPAPPGRQPPYKDIYLTEKSDRVVFGNSRLTLEFSKQTGEWMSLAAPGIPGALISRTEIPASVDFRIDDVWMIEEHGAAYLRNQATVDEARDAATLCVAVGAGQLLRPPMIPERWRARSGQVAPPAYDYELQSCYTLFAGQSRIERTATLNRVGGTDILASPYVRLQGFLFQVPNAVVAAAPECTVETPGPLSLGSYLPPGTPYPAVAKRFLSTGGAPDGGFGIVAFANKTRNATLGIWMDTQGDAGWSTYLSGDGERITVLQHDRRLERMAKGWTVASDVQHIELVEGPPPAVYARYRQMTERTMPLAADTPEWTKQMVLLEVLPTYFPDGLQGLTRKLPFYKKVGFNTVYLMPHWVGGYSPIDPYKVNPAIGNEDGLKQMVRTAHSLGMRVLFDMVIHGFDRRSDIVRLHPEFFAQDGFGAIVKHQTWTSMSTDPASPAYQQYMADLVVHDIKTYDNDGYRVDANAYKLPNWDPHAPYSPGYSSAATRQLMQKILAAMRAEKPDSVLLSEIFGPVWHSICNLVHDNNTQGPQAILETMDRGEMTPEQYKEHIARILDLLPPGALRVRFARNHDTSWFYHFNGYTPRFMAMDAVHTMFGIPEVFAGDSRNPPHPDTDPAVYDYYRKLFAARKEFAELTSGEILLRGVESGNPWVIAGARRLNGNTVAVIVSMSDKEETANLSIEGKTGTFLMTDPIAGSRVPVEAGAVKLKPFQVLLGRP